MRTTDWDPTTESLFEAERPGKWDELVGNDYNRSLLEGMVLTAGGKPGVILLGPYGCGKTTSARIFARSVLCEGRAPDDATPCWRCDMCRSRHGLRRVNYGSIFVERTAADYSLSQLREDLALREKALNRMVLIIDEFHRAREKLHDRLLSAVEEGHDGFVLVLATADQSCIEPPMRQRLPTLSFEKPPMQEVRDYLIDVNQRRGLDIPSEMVDTITERGVSIRDCLNLMQQSWTALMVKSRKKS